MKDCFRQTMSAGPGRLVNTLPTHLKIMKNRYPREVILTEAGKRLMDEDVWNHGLRKNMPAHFKVINFLVLKFIALHNLPCSTCNDLVGRGLDFKK